MINNHYTLAALISEIRSDVESSMIAACLTRSENVLEIILAGKIQQPVSLVVSCKPRLNYMFIDGHPGKKVRGANVLAEAVGKTVDSLAVRHNDRSVIIKLSDNMQITVNLFGTHANVFLESNEKGVIGSFLKRKTSAPPGHGTP